VTGTVIAITAVIATMIAIAIAIARFFSVNVKKIINI
jgi:hypothetical protein